ncbi:MAG TPA: sigma-70 family RNA polymerase sigma factor [Verrucomicrobiae bacterium]|nr:sigma-70 family RNA polymerase sigma factor [Verrucomicrobiae bacterium]
MNGSAKFSKPGIIANLFAPTDEQNMWRVQNTNDPEAFARLVDRWQNPIHRLCTRMTGDSARAEDLTQEIFTKIFTRSKDFRPDSKFSTWLWRIALNHCYDELRRVKRRPESALDDDPEFPSIELAPDAQTAADEECALVRASLLRLPEISRTVLALRYSEGLKLREISEILDLPESTIHSRIAVALGQITRILEPQLRDPVAPRPKQFPQAVL